MGDTDSDGLYDRYEWDVFKTNSNLVDTDKDGTLDGDEDHDADGITNWEYQLNAETPLIAAVQQGNTEKAMLMIVSGSEDLNAEDARGRTALMVAAETGNTKLVEAILDSGIDVNARDKNGRTALGWAIEGGHDEAVEMLRESAARE